MMISIFQEFVALVTVFLGTIDHVNVEITLIRNDHEESDSLDPE